MVKAQGFKCERMKGDVGFSMLMKGESILIVLLLLLAAGISSTHTDSQKSTTSLTSQSPTPQYDTISDDARTTQTASSIAMMQNEPSIAINPTKTSNIIVGYNDASPLPGSCPRGHYSVSTDGGTTWTSGTPLPTTGLSATPCTGSPTPTGYICCDTALAFDSLGNAYLATMTWNNKILLFKSAPDGSGNAGGTWTGPYIVGTSSIGIDKPAIAVDRTGGPHNGNIYIAWVDYTGSNALLCSDTTMQDRILVRTATLSGGVPTFSGSAVQASSASSSYNWGPALAVAPSGSLYVAYQRMPTICISPANAIMISRSDDGGGSFALLGGVVDGSPTSPPSPFSGSRASALPAITTTSNGTVFVAWTDSGAGNMDVQSRASTSSGASWNARVRINNIATNDQFLPGVASLGSSIYAFFYSRQSDLSNTNGGLYQAISSNGGASFAAATAFSSTFSNPNVCSTGWRPCLWGDYIGADAASTGAFTSKACAVWGDSRDSPSIGSNDVNTYFKCWYNSIVFKPIPWWWLIIRPPVYTIMPFNICKIDPQACIARWTAIILPSEGTRSSMTVDLTAKLPPGVDISINPSTGTPPFNASIIVYFNGATCGNPESCLSNVVISASDGSNSTDIGTDTTLSNVPALITDTNIYNPGDDVNLTGIGFTSNSSVTVTLDGNAAGTPTTDNGGSFSIRVSLPSNIPNGQHIFKATDSQSETASTSVITPLIETESEIGIPPALITPHQTTTLSPLALLLLLVMIGAIAVLPVRRRRGRQATKAKIVG